MGLGTSPTISFHDRIRHEQRVVLGVENLGPAVDVRLELICRPGPGPDPTPPIETMARLESGKSVKLGLDPEKVSLRFSKSGWTPVQGRVTVATQPAVLMIRLLRADRLKGTSVVGLAQLATF